MISKKTYIYIYIIYIHIHTYVYIYIYAHQPRQNLHFYTFTGICQEMYVFLTICFRILRLSMFLSPLNPIVRSSITFANTRSYATRTTASMRQSLTGTLESSNVSISILTEILHIYCFLHLAYLHTFYPMTKTHDYMGRY